jgi:hypothetical protein
MLLEKIILFAGGEGSKCYQHQDNLSHHPVALLEISMYSTYFEKCFYFTNLHITLLVIERDSRLRLSEYFELCGLVLA